MFRSFGNGRVYEVRNAFVGRRQVMEATKAPIYLLPGMAVDFPVFARLLPLLPNAFMVDFPVPYQRESLISYARRMASLLPAQSFVAGVSFGGIVALEISRILRPLGCILISSIQHPKEFPPWIRACRVIGGRTCSQAMSIFGEVARYIPKSMRTPSTLRAVPLAGPSGHWHRWATAAVLDWNPPSDFDACPLFRIHGGADTTFPARYTHPNVCIPDGLHALPVSHPLETAAAMIEFTKTI